MRRQNACLAAHGTLMREDSLGNVCIFHLEVHWLVVRSDSTELVGQPCFSNLALWRKIESNTRCLCFFLYFLPCEATLERDLCHSRLSLPARLSITLRYPDHIGCNTLKKISRLISLRFWLGLAPTWAIWSNGNTGWNKGGVIFCAVNLQYQWNWHIYHRDFACFLNTKAVLSQWKPCDASVNFDMYRNLQRRCKVVHAIALYFLVYNCDSHMSFMSYFIEVRYRRQLYRIRVSRASSILALGLIQPRASNNCNALVIMPNSRIFCARMHLIASRKQKPWAAGNLSQTTLSELSRPRSRLGRDKSQTPRRPRLSIITLIVDKPEPPQYFRQVIAYEARQPNVNIYERSLFGCMLCCGSVHWNQLWITTHWSCR